MQLPVSPMFRTPLLHWGPYWNLYHCNHGLVWRSFDLELSIKNQKSTKLLNSAGTIFITPHSNSCFYLTTSFFSSIGFCNEILKPSQDNSIMKPMIVIFALKTWYSITPHISCYFLWRYCSKLPLCVTKRFILSIRVSTGTFRLMQTFSLGKGIVLVYALVPPQSGNAKNRISSELSSFISETTQIYSIQVSTWSFKISKKCVSGESLTCFMSRKALTLVMRKMLH